MPVDDLWYLREKGPDGKRMPSSRYGRGKRWRARWTDPGGQNRTQLFAQKADAERHEAAMRADVARGKYIDPLAGKVRLSAYATKWADSQTTDPSSRRVTERGLRLHVYPILGDYELAVLAKRPSLIQNWMSGLTATLAANYVRQIFTSLSSVLQAAVDEELIPRNPCRLSSVSPPAQERKRVEPWTRDRVADVRAALPATVRAMIELGVGLGLRQGEALGLSPDDIDWIDQRVVHVRRQVKVLGSRLVFAPPKGGKERDVPLPEGVSLALAAHLQQFPARAVTLPWRDTTGRPVTVPLLFTTRTGNARDRCNVNRYWKRALIEAGILPAPQPGEYFPESRKDGFHALRHTFASMLLHDGVDIRTLAAYLGHSDPGFTLRTYTHLMPSAPNRARKAVDHWFEGQDVPELYPHDQQHA